MLLNICALKKIAGIELSFKIEVVRARIISIISTFLTSRNRKCSTFSFVNNLIIHLHENFPLEKRKTVAIFYTTSRHCTLINQQTVSVEELSADSWPAKT